MFTLIFVLISDPFVYTPGPELIMAKPPDNYKVWEEAETYIDFAKFGYFYNYYSKIERDSNTLLSDTLLLPYECNFSPLNFENCSIDTVHDCGIAHYYTYRGTESWTKVTGEAIFTQSITVLWLPRHKTDIKLSRLRHDLLPSHLRGGRFGSTNSEWISVNSKGIEKIEIDNNKAYCLRCFSHQEDLTCPNIVLTEKITKYFIPTKHYDFLISCRDVISIYDEEWIEMNSHAITLDFRWSCSIDSNDVLNEPERAVEQTFKLKPETKRETAPPSD